MKTNKRERLKTAIENALCDRKFILSDILYSIYDSELSNKSEIAKAKRAKNEVERGLSVIQTNIVDNGILHKRKDGIEVKGYWKYVKEADTADKLIVPFIETLYPSLTLVNQRTDGTYIYDSVISGSKFDLLLEYKKVGYYFHDDCFSLDDLRLFMNSNNMLNSNNSNYLRSGLRNQAVSYLAKGSDSTSGFGMIIITNGIWYNILLTGVFNYTDDERLELESILGTKLNGSNCDVLKNCGISVMQFSIYDSNVLDKIILFKHFVGDYLEYSERFKNIVSELRLCFVDRVKLYLQEV